MATPAHPDAMKPAGRERTRTAAPMMPDTWWSKSPRYRGYIAYGASGLVMWLVASVMIRALWALGSGPAAWNQFQESLQHPIYIGFHVFSLLVVVWFGARTFFKLFAKTQPPRIGPAPRPPLEVFPPVLAAVWLVASAVLISVLWGVWP